MVNFNGLLFFSIPSQISRGFRIINLFSKYHFTIKTIQIIIIFLNQLQRVIFSVGNFFQLLFFNFLVTVGAVSCLLGFSYRGNCDNFKTKTMQILTQTTYARQRKRKNIYFNLYSSISEVGLHLWLLIEKCALYFRKFGIIYRTRYRIQL